MALMSGTSPARNSSNKRSHGRDRHSVLGEVDQRVVRMFAAGDTAASSRLISTVFSSIGRTAAKIVRRARALPRVVRRVMCAVSRSMKLEGTRVARS
jgi:hypothetical protein